MHGTASSRHGLQEPQQQSFPGGSVGPGVLLKGAGQQLSVLGLPHQGERDASLLMRLPHFLRSRFQLVYFCRGRAVLTCLLRQVSYLL